MISIDYHHLNENIPLLNNMKQGDRSLAPKNIFFENTSLF